MDNNSLIQGTTWRWRKTFINVPMHACGRFSGATDVKELCLVVDTPETTKRITEELGNAGIQIQQKEVHIASDHIPEGSKILYVREPNKKIEDEENDFEEAEKNLQKLQDYIRQNGGKIEGEKPPVPIGKSLFQFWRRRFTTKN